MTGAPAQGIEGSGVPGEAIEAPQREIVNAIRAMGLEPAADDVTQLGQIIGTMNAWDVPFMAGWGGNGNGEDLAAQTYGAVVAARGFKITAEHMRCEVAPVGADIIADVRKNGVSIYTRLPKIADGGRTGRTGILTTVPGPLSVDTGDLLEFIITQVGSRTAGQKLTFSLAGTLS